MRRCSSLGTEFLRMVGRITPVPASTLNSARIACAITFSWSTFFADRAAARRRFRRPDHPLEKRREEPQQIAEQIAEI